MKNFKKYNEAVEYLENLPSIANGCFVPAATKNPSMYLEKTKFFLNLIGNPQDKLKFVHVTGTSGKGSVCAFLANILTASGKKTGLFSSPYVTASTEKASIDGEYISPDEFAEIVEFFKSKIDEANEKCPYGRPTYFEIFFALALYYFAKKKCDIVVLEVGCGGRYDATNVIENTIVAAITNIDFDHTQIIGDTLEKIAFEKAGIIKKGSVLFTNEKEAGILEIFDKELESVGSKKEKVLNLVKNVEYVEGGMNLEIDGISGSIFSSLWGSHQVDNIKLAISIAKYLGVTEDVIKNGLEKTNIPCRFETVQKNPKVVLDGAHNPSKMQSAANNIKKLSYRKLILVLGISQTKDAVNSLKKIVPLVDHLIATSISFGKYLEMEKLLEIAKNFSKKEAVLESEKNIFKALDRAISIAKEDDLILIAGSFYLAGEVRKRWFPEKYVIEKRSSF